MVIIRATVGKKGSPQEFLWTVDPASLTGEPDPCDSADFRAENKGKCKCKRDFAIENGLDSVPLCLVTDTSFQEDLFKRFIGTVMLPDDRLFGPGTYTFAVTSFGDYAIHNPDPPVPPFYGILDFTLAVK